MARAVQVSGHGNFGSLDNDPAAAMRYTECRLQAFASAVLLADLEFDTVGMAPTFDGSQARARAPHSPAGGLVARPARVHGCRVLHASWVARPARALGCRVLHVPLGGRVLHTPLSAASCMRP